jgi:hypothetical protein
MDGWFKENDFGFFKNLYYPAIILTQNVYEQSAKEIICTSGSKINK